MKFGDRATFEITDIDRKGRGCGVVGNRPACAYFTLPGEEVEATLVKRQQGTLRFQLENVTKPSADRVEPRCKFAGRCGGCVWQMFDYRRQLELKRQLVNRSLASAGLGEPIEAVVPCPEPYGFRNRMDYCVSWRGEVGLKSPGQWNHYLDLTECHLLSPDAVKATNAFREWMRTNNVPPWDSVKYTGYLRYLVIREGKNTGERMLMVITSAGPLPAEQELLAALSPFATSIIHGINPTITDLSVASEMRALKGELFLHESVGGKTFIIPPNSFFQTNTVMAGKMLEVVRDMLADNNAEGVRGWHGYGDPGRVQPHATAGGEHVRGSAASQRAADGLQGQPGVRLAISDHMRVERAVTGPADANALRTTIGVLLDLYCGVGFFGIGLADIANKIVGVELDSAAIEVARRNAEMNGIKNAEFHAAPAEDLSWESEKPDVVIIDPPRSGLHPKVAKLLVEKKPERIIYVSCNHDSFARDWKILSQAYRLDRAVALDLFPHGPHVELVTSLVRK